MASYTRDDQDFENMRRLASGDEEALKSLMKRHKKRLYDFFFRNLRNPTEAAEFVEEVFIRVYRHRKRFNYEAKVSTWMYAIAKNLLRTHVRSQRGREFIPLKNDGFEILNDQEDSQPLLIDSKPTPQEAMQLQERFTVLYNAIDDLPANLRRTFVLFELKELPVAEIARRQNCSQKTVEMQLYHARQRLRKRFRKLSDVP